MLFGVLCQVFPCLKFSKLLGGVSGVLGNCDFDVREGRQSLLHYKRFKSQNYADIRMKKKATRLVDWLVGVGWCRWLELLLVLLAGIVGWCLLVLVVGVGWCWSRNTYRGG